MPNAIVVGAGVIGLSTAIVLRQSGHDVNIVAETVSPQTTSDVAAAFWFPYMAFPEERVNKWGAATLQHLLKLQDHPTAGVVSRTGFLVISEHDEIPSWTKVLSGVKVNDNGNGERTVEFDTCVIDMTRYMKHLNESFAVSGGTIEISRLNSFNALLEQYDTVINCTGLGARDLAEDENLFPARGQVVRVSKTAELNHIWLDDRIEERFTMIVPRITDVILGGTYEKGVEDTTIDDNETRAILQRCTSRLPAVSQLEVLGAACGLRPVRHEVRVEKQVLPDGKMLIHNYGHGGAGVTLSYGCALEVLSMLTCAPSVVL